MALVIMDTIFVLLVILMMLYQGADINQQFIEHKTLLISLKQTILQLKNHYRSLS